jgi:hypothetical protein
MKKHLCQKKNEKTSIFNEITNIQKLMVNNECN